MNKLHALYLVFILSFIVGFGLANFAEASMTWKGNTGGGGHVIDMRHDGASNLWQATDSAIDDVGDELGSPSILENWQIILAFLLPLAISVVVKLDWEPWKKSLAAFLIALIATAVGTYLKGDIDSGTDIIANVLKVFALTIPFYYGLWKPLGATGEIHEKTG